MTPSRCTCRFSCLHWNSACSFQEKYSTTLYKRLNFDSDAFVPTCFQYVSLLFFCVGFVRFRLPCTFLPFFFFAKIIFAFFSKTSDFRLLKKFYLDKNIVCALRQARMFLFFFPHGNNLKSLLFNSFHFKNF